VRADFTQFYEDEVQRMVRSLTLVTGDLTTAEEVVAEAFARAWSRWPQVSATRRPGAWVMRVALNLANDRWRRRRIERRKAAAVARADESWDPQPQIDQRLWRAVRDLPEHERTLVALRYIADLSQVEIAEALGVATGTVASGLNRARHKLGVALGSAYQEELT
jgi:RNA polymerase sigma-70 factor (sigma-E family)